MMEQLEEAEAELAMAVERVKALEGERGHEEPLRGQPTSCQLDDLQVQLEEEHDLVDRKQWEMDELKHCRELEILWAKESVREIHAAHAEELRARDKLIHLLKEQCGFLGETESTKVGEP